MPNTQEQPVTKSEVKEIVEAIVDKAVGGLALSINAAFTEQQKQIFGLGEKIELLEVKVDKGFARVDEKFEGMNQRIDAVNNRIDDIATNYTRRDEHKKLEKRVEKLEVAVA